MRYRVHEVAQLSGASVAEVINFLGEIGEFVRSSASAIEEPVFLRALDHFRPKVKTKSEPIEIEVAEPSPVQSSTPSSLYSTWQANPVPPPRNQDVLDKIGSLEKMFPVAAQHRAMLTALGSQFVYAKKFRAPDGKTLGAALARFSGAIEAAFGITREVLFFYTPYRDLQIRAFSWAKEQLQIIPRDATPDLIMFYSPDERLTIKLEDWSRIAFKAIPLTSDLDSEPIALVKLLRDHVYARDLFYETTPVRGDRFFGRKTLLQELKEDVTHQRVSGLFGLRKSGKTSLLLQLAEGVESDSRIPVFVDLEVLPSPPDDPSLPFVSEICNRIETELKKRSIRATELVEISNDPDIAGFKTGLQKLLARLDRSGVSIALFLDEIEFLTPTDQVDTAEGEFSGISQTLGVLRSMVQTTENFTFLLAGLTNDVLENGRLYGRPNPLFAWAKARYVGPFPRAEADELARAVGARMGIEIEVGALEALYDASGGHAYLYRNLASAVVSELPVDTYRRVMRKSDVLHRLIPWKRSIAGNIDEILGHLRRYYPTESILLEVLIESPGDFRDLAESEDRAVHHLVGLGLIHEDRGRFTPSILLELK